MKKKRAVLGVCLLLVTCCLLPAGSAWAVEKKAVSYDQEIASPPLERGPRNDGVGKGEELTGPRLAAMADTQLAGGKKEEAMATWGKILASEPDPGTRIRYAYFLSRAGEEVQAIQVMQTAAASFPSPSLRYWIADAYTRLGKNPEAMKELQGMLKDFPEEKLEIERRLGLLKPAGKMDRGRKEDSGSWIVDSEKANRQETKEATMPVSSKKVTTEKEMGNE